MLTHGQLLRFRSRSPPLPYFYHLPIAAVLLHCVRDLGHNSQLLGNGTALYGYPGNEAQEYPGCAIGAGLPITMSSITTSAFDTPARRSVERTCADLALLALAVVTIV